MTPTTVAGNPNFGVGVLPSTVSTFLVSGQNLVAHLCRHPHTPRPQPTSAVVDIQNKIRLHHQLHSRG